MIFLSGIDMEKLFNIGPKIGKPFFILTAANLANDLEFAPSPAGSETVDKLVVAFAPCPATAQINGCTTTACTSFGG